MGRKKTPPPLRCAVCRRTKAVKAAPTGEMLCCYHRAAFCRNVRDIRRLGGTPILNGKPFAM